MESNIALTISQLSFAFDKNKPFFENINITFKANKIHFVCGKNGAGKSTLFKILQGNITPNEQVSGSITINSKTYPITNSYSKNIFAKQVRTVQQKFDRMLADQYSFVENLQFAQLPKYPGLQKLSPAPKLPNIIARFGIDIHKPTRLLSGGQRQILAILMVLQKPAPILLLDEPTAALDEKNAQMVMLFLQELVTQQNITILVISHDTELVTTHTKKHYFKLYSNQENNIRSIRKIIP